MKPALPTVCSQVEWLQKFKIGKDVTAYAGLWVSDSSLSSFWMVSFSRASLAQRDAIGQRNKEDCINTAKRANTKRLSSKNVKKGAKLTEREWFIINSSDPLKLKTIRLEGQGN
ncbi:MAG: hypothetical protein KGK02_09930 [Rhodospirillales bacterium]|nr:hypothetical protein [Rhodospirillales bacterium]